MTDDLSTKAREAAERLRESLSRSRKTLADDLLIAAAARLLDQLTEAKEKAEARAKELEADQREWNESQRLFEVEVIPRLESERDAANEKVAVVEALLDEIAYELQVHQQEDALPDVECAGAEFHLSKVAAILSKRENQKREGGTE